MNRHSPPGVRIVAGLMAALFVAAPGVGSQQRPPGPTVVYASVGDHLRQFTFDAANGSLSQGGAAPGLPAEIHYVAMHPSRRWLYVSASDRAKVNQIHAFSVAPATGALSRAGDPVVLPDTLSRAVHISVDRSGRYLLTAHNVTETIAAIELQPDGRLGRVLPQPAIQKLGFLVHQILPHPAGAWVFVPVRGNDPVAPTPAAPAAPERPGRLHVFSFENGAFAGPTTTEYEPGSGPRHVDFHPTRPWVYVLTERGNQLITYRHEPGALKELFRSTTLRDPSFRFPAQRAGAIHVHPSGRWVYTTNRNVAPCASSMPCPDRHSKPFDRGENNLAVFSIDATTGNPTLVQHVESHGFEPRTFTIDPSGRYLIAGNMMNIVRREGAGIVDVQPNLSVFRIGAMGTLTFVRHYEQPDAGLIWWVGAYTLAGPTP